MDNLLWLYDTPNAAVNYLNSCQTYDRYRMQVTDHRSQVQVRVKVTMLRWKKIKLKQCFLALIRIWNRVQAWRDTVYLSYPYLLTEQHAVTSLALVTCDLCFVPATKLTNSSIVTAKPKFCVSFPAKVPPQFFSRLLIQPNSLHTEILTLSTSFVNIFLFLFDPEYWNCCQQTL